MKGEPMLILFVEDDAAHAEIAMRNLEDSKVANRIVHLTNGQQALDYLFRQGDYADPASSPRPHLILLDLRLPKVDGLEVAERIKKDPVLRFIPIVILTTSNAEADVVKAYSYNINSYLVKPLDFEKFNELISSFNFYWMLWNVYPY